MVVSRLCFPSERLEWLLDMANRSLSYRVVRVDAWI